MKRYLLILLALVAGLAAGAQKVKTVEGTFTYTGSDNESRRDCMARALEYARLDALAREFGTNVTSDIVQQENVGGQLDGTYFDARSETSVRGEWIADDGEPKYEFSMSPDGLLIVKCTVKGRAREISNQGVEFTATVLRNGMTEREAATEFRSGDQMSLFFRAPTDGYISVFLFDETGTVFTLLPYMGNRSGQMAVEGDTDYVFFNLDFYRKQLKLDGTHPIEKLGEPDVMVMTTGAEVERNVLLVLFSPNPFTGGIGHGSGNIQIDYGNRRQELTLPRSMRREEFNKWLTKTQTADKRMTSFKQNILIRK